MPGTPRCGAAYHAVAGEVVDRSAGGGYRSAGFPGAVLSAFSTVIRSPSPRTQPVCNTRCWRRPPSGLASRNPDDSVERRPDDRRLAAARADGVGVGGTSSAPSGWFTSVMIAGAGGVALAAPAGEGVQKPILMPVADTRRAERREADDVLGIFVEPCCSHSPSRPGTARRRYPRFAGCARCSSLSRQRAAAVGVLDDHALDVGSAAPSALLKRRIRWPWPAESPPPGRPG